MKAARLHACRTPLRLDDLPAPEPGPGEVVIRVGGSGFCHSDLHIIDGELHVPQLPLTLGHENAGWVAALGAGVRSVREGDPVVVYGGWGCGLCDYCVGGIEQLCEQARFAGVSGVDGGYAEYLRVPAERYLVPLRQLAPRDAAPLSDAALTPYRAVRLALPYLQPDHPVLLVGLGGLGEFGLKLLRLFSGCPVVVVDTSQTKRQLALALGAWQTLDGHDPQLPERLRDLTNGRGVCASFDFVGTSETLALCIGATRSRGKVSQVGLAGGSASLTVMQNSRFEVAFEATLWGSLKELREVVALADSGRLPMIPLEFAPLDEINAVAGRLRAGNVSGRIVLTP